MSVERYREALKVRQGYWFAPKLFGWGATPVTWQGWLITMIFVAACIVVLRWAPTHFVRLGVLLPMLALFIGFTWTKTDGGFRWRWGPED